MSAMRVMRRKIWLLASLALVALALCSWLQQAQQLHQPQNQERLLVASAADFRPALDELRDDFQRRRPDVAVDVVYGASGKLSSQIEQGAPFDIFFSADSDYPQRLFDHGHAGGQPVTYAIGRLAIWSTSHDVGHVDIADLAKPEFGRIAIANPQHAPYGKRAEQALRAAGVWEQVQQRLVFGDNVTHAAQFVRSGNADIGIIATSFTSDGSTWKGSHAEVPPSLHEPLRQSFVLTRTGADKAIAREFAAHVQGEAARAILQRHGFGLPETAKEP